MYYDGIDPDGHHATDRDDDRGYLIGVSYKVDESISVGYRYTSYSRIKVSPYDEWIRGHSLSITYSF